MATATSAAHHLLRGLELPRVALGPCSCPSTCCGSCRPACPWPWKTFDRLFPVPGQGTPCSHDATDHLECAFPAAPAYARASAQVVVFSHHSRPTSPRSSQALICPRLSDHALMLQLARLLLAWPLHVVVPAEQLALQVAAFQPFSLQGRRETGLSLATGLGLGGGLATPFG